MAGTVHEVLSSYDPRAGASNAESSLATPLEERCGREGDRPAAPELAEAQSRRSAATRGSDCGTRNAMFGRLSSTFESRKGTT